MRLRKIALSLVLVTVAAPAARAAEDDVATQNAKATIAFFDKNASRAKDDQKFSELVMEVANTGHPLAAERLGKVLRKDSSLEHKMIAAAALGQMKDPDEARKAAGKALLESFEKDDFDADVKINVVESLGDLDCHDAVPALSAAALKGGDPFVLLRVVRALGKINDRRALPALLELWERHPVGYSWETGEVNVDTGSEGTADQEAAEAQWHAQYDSAMAHHKKPPVMFKVYIKELILTVRKITGDETIEKPDQFRAWMEAHREELAKEGIDIPKYKGPAKKKDDGKGGKGGKDEKDDKGGKDGKDGKDGKK